MDQEATCIRCGCTDREPCPGGCAWIRVDYDTGEGVCTSCSPLVPAAAGIQAASPLDEIEMPGFLLDNGEWAEAEGILDEEGGADD